MRRKLLVVDDDPYLTTQLRKLLESDELSVDTVSSAQEALTALGETDYSVLITDLKMPGMGGMDLIREVAQRRVLVTTPGEATFGLQSGIEFLGVPAPSEAVERANLARVHPRAMHSLRVMGARAAQEHRASLVYPRLAADLPSVA